MESKRIKFALFICVFALYGCMSTSSAGVGETMSKVTFHKNVSSHELLTNPMINDINDSIEVLAFQAYYSKQDNNQFFTSLRDESGTLFVKSNIERYSQQMNQRVKKARKEREARKAQEELKKQRAQQARLKKKEEDAKATFSAKITTYGVDCYGCGGEEGRGATASGVQLDINQGVLMPDGTWQPGIKYGKYYIIAADPSIPMCSILKISNHGLQGSGISPDEPYYAIVLDRGGAIQGSHIDLYVGTERSQAIVSVSNTTPKAQMIRSGGERVNQSCAL